MWSCSIFLPNLFSFCRGNIVKMGGYHKSCYNIIPMSYSCVTCIKLIMSCLITPARNSRAEYEYSKISQDHGQNFETFKHFPKF